MLELDRHLLLVERLLDGRVHALGERVEDHRPLGVVLAHLLVPVAAEGEQAREAIAGDVVGPEHLGQLALAVAAPHLELPHPVLRHGEALGEEQVVGVLRVDVRDAVLVAQHLHRLAHAAGDDRALVLGQRRLGQPLELGAAIGRCLL